MKGCLLAILGTPAFMVGAGRRGPTPLGMQDEGLDTHRFRGTGTLLCLGLAWFLWNLFSGQTGFSDIGDFARAARGKPVPSRGRRSGSPPPAPLVALSEE